MLSYCFIHIAISAEASSVFHFVETRREGRATANQMVANRKHAIILTEVGLEEYKSFTDIARILIKKHYNPKTLGKKVAQSFHFHTYEIRKLKSCLVITC